MGLGIAFQLSLLINQPAIGIIEEAGNDPLVASTICPQISFVPIGQPGNPPIQPSGLGRVNHEFEISKFEITNCQYVEFLNAVAQDEYGAFLYHEDMATNIHAGILQGVNAEGHFEYFTKPNFETKPVNLVSWTDAAYFVNWLENGKPSGPFSIWQISYGSYDLDTYFPYGYAWRVPSANFYLPSGSEWVKAAQYDPQDQTYSTYAVQADNDPDWTTATPNGEAENQGDFVCNYNGKSNWNGSINGNVLSVGSAKGRSFYGIADMNGNVAEWTDGVYCFKNQACARFARGGSAISHTSSVGFDGAKGLNGLTIILSPFSQIGTPNENLWRHWTVGFRIVRRTYD